MFNLYVTGKGVSDANRKELCFYMSREEEILGVDEVTVEEDVVMVVEGSKKQTLWLTGITRKNPPDRFSILPSLHLLWSS